MPDVAEGVSVHGESAAALHGKVAVVTGAAGGLGTAMTEHLVDRGASVVLVDKEADRLRAVMERIGGTSSTSSLTVDIATPDGPALVDAHAMRVFGHVDILINNAAIVRHGRAEEFSPGQWDEIMNTNIRAPFLLSQLACKRMIASGNGGSIVNIGSIGGRTGNPLNVPYGVSKTALLGLTQHLAVEWGPYGIRVNAVNPGFTTWTMRDLLPDEDVKRRQAELVPLRRIARPSDIAEAVTFLVSDSGWCISGVVIDVDGGYLPSIMARLARSSARS
jgi:NAD(P)-dependent dehydrogenase (short-subunit alcohol dehydrogenase family)